MAYGHAVLGESLELCKEAAEWGRDEQKRLQKNEQARFRVTEVINQIKQNQREPDYVPSCKADESTKSTPRTI